MQDQETLTLWVAAVMSATAGILLYIQGWRMKRNERRTGAKDTHVEDPDRSAGFEGESGENVVRETERRLPGTLEGESTSDVQPFRPGQREF